MEFLRPIIWHIVQSDLICQTWLATSPNGNIFRVFGPCAGINRSPLNSLYKGHWHGCFMFYLICAWINGWVNNHETRDCWCHRDVIVMEIIYNGTHTRVWSKYWCWCCSEILQNKLIEVCSDFWSFEKQTFPQYFTVWRHYKAIEM